MIVLAGGRFFLIEILKIEAILLPLPSSKKKLWQTIKRQRKM